MEYLYHFCIQGLYDSLAIKHFLCLSALKVYIKFQRTNCLKSYKSEWYNAVFCVLSYSYCSRAVSLYLYVYKQFMSWCGVWPSYHYVTVCSRSFVTSIEGDWATVQTTICHKIKRFIAKSPVCTMCTDTVLTTVILPFYSNK